MFPLVPYPTFQSTRKGPTTDKKKEDRLLVDNYDYSGVDFTDEHYSRIEAQNYINANIFGYENKQFYPIYVNTGSHEPIADIRWGETALCPYQKF